MHIHRVQIWPRPAPGGSRRSSERSPSRKASFSSCGSC
nr:MAG TPA: hypothetical protein [Caudoviricetes sp.]